jgi:hypothetical protein
VVAAALVVAPMAAGRVFIETNQRFSFTSNITTCTGEVIEVEVDLHFLERIPSDAHGIEDFGLTTTTHVRGTSADGGRYVGQSHHTTQPHRSLGGETTTISQTVNQNLIRLGEEGTADDLRQRIVIHLTMNANGELVVSKLEFFTECS